MQKHTQPTRPRWTSYNAFILAAVGASVGLGNVWKFPYEVGLHNGGTFVWVYIVCVFLIAFPLMLAELVVGRLGAGNPVQAISAVSHSRRRSRNWGVIAWLGVISSFLIFSYYSVVASWVLFYIMQATSGMFVNAPAEIVKSSFGALLSNTDQMLIWHSVYVLMVVLVVSRDVRTGLERALRVLMPAFIALLAWLCYYTSIVGEFDYALRYIFTFNWSLVTAELIVSALTQALFSLSIGIGILMMYGSYLGNKQALFGGAGVILVSDTLIALVVAIIIFSIVFAFGLRTDIGSGLIFTTLPVAFAQMGDNGVYIAIAFFTFLLLSALASGFALLEPFIAWQVNYFGLSRRVAAWLAGALGWSIGLLSVYSFSDLQFGFYYFDVEYQHGFFDLFNILTTHMVMPLTALLMAIFAAWRIDRADTKAAFNMRLNGVFSIWYYSTKVLVPTVLIIVLYAVLFLPA